MKTKILLILVALEFLPLSKMYCEESTVSGITRTEKIVTRSQLTFEGYDLARCGLYEEAIVKFRLAADPSLIVQEHEKAVPIGSIVDAYEREGKFEEALKEHQWFIIRHDSPSEFALNTRFKIKALLKARDIKDNKPIYVYMNYIKAKYPQYFPPTGYVVGMSGIFINEFIHLYDYMHDYDAGIAFMDEVIKYHTRHWDRNHRSAHAKDAKEYTRVKQSWELDKKTGQHGHLQDVIRTSNIISW